MRDIFTTGRASPMLFTYDFFTIVNARGAAERRFLYNPLRQLRDEEPRSPSLRRAPEDAMPQHATAWAKREFPKLPHLARRQLWLTD